MQRLTGARLVVRARKQFHHSGSQFSGQARELQIKPLKATSNESAKPDLVRPRVRRSRRARTSTLTRTLGLKMADWIDAGDGGQIQERRAQRG